MRGLEGKGVLVTGASRGIGEAAARRFLEEGCRVVICARHDHGIERAVRELGALGSVDGIACNVSDPDAVTRMIEAADAFLDGIDVLAANAGVAWQEDVLDITLGHWDEILDINLRGMFLVAQGVARRMTARANGGSIVMMSSTNAFEGEAGYAHYNASKGAQYLQSDTKRTPSAIPWLTITIQPEIIDGTITGQPVDWQLSGKTRLLESQQLRFQRRQAL